MTKLTDVQHPIHPVFQQQGPDSNCIIDGVLLGWESCSAYAMAHLIDSSTAHRTQPSGCSVRRTITPRDVTGGLTLNQVAYAAGKMGVQVDVRVGSNVVSPKHVARQIRAGRRATAQGDAIAFVGTAARSTRGAVAHCVEFNEVRGGSLDEPSEVLMLDSAADGEKHPWGRAAQSPMWISWKLAKKFMASLRPRGPGTPMIGPDWCYVAFGPDTEPHVRLLTGAHHASPFPDRTRADEATVWIHKAPKAAKSNRLYSVARDTLLTVYQYVEGESAWGSTRWGANDDGSEFVPLGALRKVGGNT